ncbi:hypothetical protein [Lysobacter sp. CA199]|uniref:hypothetical protein n=1 Tax=Lysobacter sp. CA199 TaxID=3455608 RepID=UPI003F8D22A1
MNEPTLPRVRFARKPGDLGDVLHATGIPHWHDEVDVVIEAERALTPDDYDAFAANFFQAHDWMRAFGGRNALGHWYAIRLTAPGKRTLYVNPEGLGYARYVGVAAEE